MAPPVSSALADNGNRAAAFLIDGLLLLALSASFVPRLAPAFQQYGLALLFVIYFAAMPLTRLQGSLGKWICRLRVCDRSGEKPGWRAALIRSLALVIWFALPAGMGALLADSAFGQKLSDQWWCISFLPWFFVGFMPRRESLFDLLAGTLVVKYKSTTAEIAEASTPLRQRLPSGIGLAVIGLFFGISMSSMKEVTRARDRYARIAYAIEETRALRNVIEQFHQREQTWPSHSELGIPEWHPYPDGGGYRLLGDGKIVISFTVLADLKGHTLIFTPIPAAGGQITWLCQADTAIEKRYLPGTCR